MSRQYYAKNPEAKGFWGEEGYFDVNVSGAQLLGIISFRAGYYSQALRLRSDEMCTPMVASKVMAEEGARKIRALTAAQKKQLWKDTGGTPRPKYGRMQEFEFEDFCRFIGAWAKFLDTCGGYDTDPPDGVDEWRKR